MDSASSTNFGAADKRLAVDATTARSIGDIISELRSLSAEQVESVLHRQRETGERFGEAAVALGLATADDVLFALSQQFQYPFAPQERRILGEELVVLNEPFSPRAEYFRALRSQVLMRLFSDVATRPCVAVISAEESEGKTYCAANLAVALAQLGGRTLLVDADLRSPRVHEVFKVDNRSGLSNVLSGRADKGVIQSASGVESLFVMPAGTTPPNPQELVERSAFALLMRELQSKFDHVVVDTPAASFGADAAVIASRCGGAVVVARRNKTRMAQLQDLVAGFDGSSVRLAGVVVNEF